jgi:hypothetical protein
MEWRSALRGFRSALWRDYSWDWLAVALLILLNRVLKRLPHFERAYDDQDSSLKFPLQAGYISHDVFWSLVLLPPPLLFGLCQAPRLLRGAILPALLDWRVAAARAAPGFHSTWLPRAGPFRIPGCHRGAAMLRCAVLRCRRHQGTLTFYEAYTMNSTLKHLLERVGRLRPTWCGGGRGGGRRGVPPGAAVCKGTSHPPTPRRQRPARPTPGHRRLARLETGDAKEIRDGRESFPSGRAPLCSVPPPYLLCPGPARRKLPPPPRCPPTPAHTHTRARARALGSQPRSTPHTPPTRRAGTPLTSLRAAA